MKTRREIAQELRNSASHIAYLREHPKHCSNGEEYEFRHIEKGKQGTCPKDAGPTHLTNFTKGLPHNEDGSLVNPDHYQKFVIGIQSGNPADFEKTPLGPFKLKALKDGKKSKKGLAHEPHLSTDGCKRRTYLADELTSGCPKAKEYWYSQAAQDANDKKGANVRAWESAGAGKVFDLQGPDAQAVTMPPAPKLHSANLAAEMSEVYAMALLRDTHFRQFRTEGHPKNKQLLSKQFTPKEIAENEFLEMYDCEPELTVNEVIEALHQFENDVPRLGGLTGQKIFRGFAKGDDVGPYISQFLLIGNSGINKNDLAHNISDGFAAYGPIHADQRVRVAKPCKDYMTTYEAWLDVQNGADLRGSECYVTNEGMGDKHAQTHRFITTPRDLATYVHYDALYEAYLNACLIMLGMGIPFDRGIPFQAADNVDKQQGFAHFGGPHILSLVTEVATRALKAVRYQKFNVHRRARPEAFGGLIDCYMTEKKNGGVEYGDYLEPVGKLATQIAPSILTAIVKHNKNQNSTYKDRKSDLTGKGDRYLLPMAFPEGSPMHPSYGAGHATVAGACVTILKAYFDHGALLTLGHDDKCGYHLEKQHGKYSAFEANDDGSELVPVKLQEPLTVEGELNKLAANISIGRNWAGVHYYSDYEESLLMGEEIALGILEEQKLTYSENFTMTVPLFEGGTVRI